MKHLLAGLIVLAASVGFAAEKAPKVVLIAGRPSHPPRMHEFNAGVQLLAKCMQDFHGVRVEYVLNGWPQDERIFDDAAAVVFYMDGGGGHEVVKENGRRKAIVERLRQVGRWAADAHVTIGIETSLPAKDERDLLGEIGSEAIRIYYNFQNGLRSGRKIIDELETLGAENIVQIHATNDDGYWLEDDRAIDMPAIRRVLDQMKWSGWLVLERSRHRDHGRDVKLNFSKNASYLKRVFQSPAATGGSD